MSNDKNNSIIDDLLSEEESLRFDEWSREYAENYPQRDLNLVTRPVNEIIKNINSKGVAILLVEQNAKRALNFSDRGYVLDQGRNAYQGNGQELLNDPRVVDLYLGKL